MINLQNCKGFCIFPLLLIKFELLLLLFELFNNEFIVCKLLLLILVGVVPFEEEDEFKLNEFCNKGGKDDDVTKLLLKPGGGIGGGGVNESLLFNFISCLFGTSSFSYNIKSCNAFVDSHHGSKPRSSSSAFIWCNVSANKSGIFVLLLLLLL